MIKNNNYLKRLILSWKSRSPNDTQENVVSLAFRDNNGPIGGPGGVLFRQKEILGKNGNGANYKYFFRNDIAFSELKGNNYDDFIKSISWGEEVAKRSQFQYFVCHDIGSAYGVYLANKPYIIIYHQQGTLYSEFKAFSQTSDESIRNLYYQVERTVFKNASKVYFPSSGASNEFFDDQYCSIKKEDVNLGHPLYNTLLINRIGYKEVPELEHNSSYYTFFTACSLIELKGVDRVPEALNFFSSLLDKPIRWVVCGVGPLKDSIIEMSEKFGSYELIYLGKQPHSVVQYCMQLADFYILLHRKSIFDMSTLEAMVNKCAIVLSKTGGNLDFNKEDNIIFYDKEKNDIALTSSDIEKFKEKNKDVYFKHFSSAHFKYNYSQAIAELLAK